MSFLLRNVRQVHGNACFAACLAILTGQRVSLITSIFHHRYYTGKESPIQIMDVLHLPYESYSAGKHTELSAYKDGAYLCSAPSLTQQGRMHYIVLEKNGEQYQVLDPMAGSGKPYYTVHTDDTAGSVPLTNWIVDAFFPFDALKARMLH